MASIHRSALVKYSSEQMFDLVTDIEKYPEFMQGCKRAVVHSRSDNELVGSLFLSKAGIRQEFTTRNVLDRPHSINMELVKGKFRKFNSRWTFEELADNGCKVSLHMTFEFDLSLVGFAAEKLLSASANSLVDSLVSRAKRVYG